MSGRSFVLTMKILLGGGIGCLVVSIVLPSLQVVQWIGLGIIFSSPIMGSLDRALSFGKAGEWKMVTILSAVWIAFAIVAIFSLR